MKGPSAQALRRYAERCLGLEQYLHQPGDGRPQPVIAAITLLWSMLLARILREISFHAVEQLVHSASCTALGVQRKFGDDALGYFTERLDPAVTRAALVSTLHRAKRNKAFDNSRFIGLAIDGTGTSRSEKQRCTQCRPRYNGRHEVCGYSHHLSLITVVGTDLSLPFDVEPYGPGDSEYSASRRLLDRAVHGLGVRFADYVVADGEYAGQMTAQKADQLLKNIKRAEAER